MDGPAICLAVLAAGSTAYCAVAWGCFEKWMREESDARTRSSPRRSAPNHPAITFFRPLKAGVPRMREKLELHLRAMNAGDQVIFGVDAGSPEMALGEELRGAFPDRDVAVVVCAPGAARNPKISKLKQMTLVARHEHWLVADSEALLDAEFLAAFRGDWAGSGADVLTAAYRIAGLDTWPERLDAAAVLLTLWPGLAVLRLGKIRLTLGACTALRGPDMAAIGGWQAFGDDLAEDNRIGAALARAGRTIRLSTAVVTLESDSLGWGTWWRHQRRVAVTYRVGNPPGFAASIITHGELWALALLAIEWQSGIVVFVSVWAVRAALTARMARRIPFPLPSSPLALLVASLTSSACWLASWATHEVWWGSRRWRVSFRGKLTEI
jgi:ceramide glucosyltransferase